MKLAYSSRGDTMNEFQENLADTAERTLAERHMEAVRQQGGMFVEAVRVTRMPMLVTDATLPGNPIIFVNRAFTDLSGYAEEELLGQDPHFMNGAETDPASIRQYEAAIEDSRDETLELLQYRKDGAPFRAMLFASPLDDGQGKVTNHFLSYLEHHATLRCRRQAPVAHLRLGEASSPTNAGFGSVEREVASCQ